MTGWTRAMLCAGAVWAGALGAAGLGSAAAADTLADALVAGYEASGLLEQNRALLRAADEDVAQAIASLRPIVNWQLQTTITPDNADFNQDVTNTILAISAELLLWDGGASRLAVETQKEVVLATRAGLVQIEQQVLLRIVEAYLEVQRAAAFVDLREGNVRLITQELRAAQDRFEVGEVTRTDVSLAEARLAAARSLLAAEQGRLARALAEYEAAVGRPARALAPVAPVAIRQTLPEAQAFARSNHPSIAEARHTVAAAELNVLRAEAAMQPTLRGGVQVAIDDEFDPREELTLRLSGPIYQGGRLTSQVRQFMARRDAARAGLLVATQAVTQNVANAWSFLEAARASREASERQVRAATQAFEGVREEATLGARTTLDVLDAEQELLDARTSLVSAQIDETVAGYTLLAAMGLLTATHLNLPVQVYDPEAYYELVDDAPAALSVQGEALDRVLRAIGQD